MFVFDIINKNIVKMYSDRAHILRNAFLVILHTSLIPRFIYCYYEEINNR